MSSSPSSLPHEGVEYLISLGYPAAEASDALLATQGDVSRALDILVAQHPTSSSSPHHHAAFGGSGGGADPLGKIRPSRRISSGAVLHTRGVVSWGADDDDAAGGALHPSRGGDDGDDDRDDVASNGDAADRSLRDFCASSMHNTADDVQDAADLEEDEVNADLEHALRGLSPQELEHFRTMYAGDPVACAAVVRKDWPVIAGMADRAPVTFDRIMRDGLSLDSVHDGEHDLDELHEV